jgi:hypothetical protein
MAWFSLKRFSTASVFLAARRALPSSNRWTQAVRVALALGAAIELVRIPVAWVFRSFRFKAQLVNAIDVRNIDVRPDANALQDIRHLPVLATARLSMISTLDPFGCYYPLGSQVVDLELMSQLMAPAIVSVPRTDLAMMMQGALRRYHQVNSDRTLPLRFSQDVNNNSLQLAYCIVDDAKFELEQMFFRG